mgnify:CR=1 FL=1
MCQGALNKKIALSEMFEYLPMSKSSFYAVLRGQKRLTLQEANTISGEFDLLLDEIAKAELETLEITQPNNP